MLGVVVWANKTREKAVIWCEDNGALAYLQGRDALQVKADWPESGDLVDVETELRGNLRHAVQVSLMGEFGKSQLPDMLRNAAVSAEPHLTLVSSSDGTRPRSAVTDAPQSTDRRHRIFATR